MRFRIANVPEKKMDTINIYGNIVNMCALCVLYIARQRRQKKVSEIPKKYQRTENNNQLFNAERASTQKRVVRLTLAVLWLVYEVYV